MNGPSLADDIEDIVRRDGAEYLAVNHFADSEHFTRLRPELYVIQDTYFWNDSVLDTYRKRRDHTLTVLNEKVSWDMRLFVPRGCSRRNWLREQLPNPRIKLIFFNSDCLRLHKREFGAFIGSPRWLFWMWRREMLSPSPENVLVAALYITQLLGFRHLEIKGADFSFFRELTVDQECNRVGRIVRHFNDEEFRPTFKDKQGLRESTMAYEMMRWSRAFASLEAMAQYLEWSEVEVLNASRHSYIDSLPRPTPEDFLVSESEGHP